MLLMMLMSTTFLSASSWEMGFPGWELPYSHRRGRSRPDSRASTFLCSRIVGYFPSHPCHPPQSLSQYCSPPNITLKNVKTLDYRNSPPQSPPLLPPPLRRHSVAQEFPDRCNVVIKIFRKTVLRIMVCLKDIKTVLKYNFRTWIILKKDYPCLCNAKPKSNDKMMRFPLPVHWDVAANLALQINAHPLIVAQTLLLLSLPDIISWLFLHMLCPSKINLFTKTANLAIKLIQVLHGNDSNWLFDTGCPGLWRRVT